MVHLEKGKFVRDYKDNYVSTIEDKEWKKLNDIAEDIKYQISNLLYWGAFQSCLSLMYNLNKAINRIRTERGEKYYEEE